MKIAIYGLPSSGKTTMLQELKKLNVCVVSGSKILNKMSNGRFRFMNDEEKNRMRLMYTEYIEELAKTNKTVVSDGHYSFEENVVFTEADGEVYDVYIYLYCPPQILRARYDNSIKNKQYADMSYERIKKWQQFEIESLRAQCHKRNKDFYIISDNASDKLAFKDFFNMIKDGFSIYDCAQEISRMIMSKYPDVAELYIVDGDKTTIYEDSFKTCCDGSTKVFDGNFYSAYQSFLFEREISDNKSSEIKIPVSQLRINNEIYEIIKDKKYVILSSGLEKIWNAIAKEKKLNKVIATPYMCADAKYYVVKILKQHGYKIKAYGDSKIDLYMLKEADEGVLYIGDKLSRTLEDENLDGVKLMYNKKLRIIDKTNYSNRENKMIKREIAICKSNSGVNGARLAKAHQRLGKIIGMEIAKLIPQKGTAILVMERGGRFFGDGVYTNFGGEFHSVTSMEQIDGIDAERVIIVDSVINTGKTVCECIQKLKSVNPDTEIIIAANVIQQKALELLKEYSVYAVRISDNMYVGKNQIKQIGTTGPDTADRLFNLIKLVI